ncbi:MAG: hypothetical protein KGJ58_01875, partial [Patescibacteria group bacterium]|nr:hypothetical protein [Patescibacteria group bacterium]
MRSHYIVLFGNNSEESLTARNKLMSKKINFAEMEADPKEFSKSDLPILITGEGQFSGLNSIEKYIEDI